MQLLENVVDFNKLSVEKKQVLFEELETFDRQIFPNTIPAELHQLVYNPDVVALPIIRFYHRGKIVGQKNWGQKNGRLGSLMFFIFLPTIFLPYQMHDRSSSAKLKMQFGANAS